LPAAVSLQQAIKRFIWFCNSSFGVENGKGKFERTKPHVNVGTIGHVDHGKPR
jgi:GTPase